MARRAEDQRECFIEEVDNAVDPAVVYSSGESNTGGCQRGSISNATVGLRLSEEEAERPSQRDGKQGMQPLFLVRIRVCDMLRSGKPFRTQPLPQPLRFLIQDDRMASLRDGELQSVSF